MQLLLLFLTALFIAMVTVPLLMKLAGRLRLLDLPDDRKLHTAAIPRVGGIGIVLGAAAAVALWTMPDPVLRAIILGVFVLSLFGMADDRWNLDYRLKFLGQFLAVLVVVGLGQVLIRRLGLFGIEALPDGIAYTLTVLFLLGTTNAMNLSDGLDGLAAGLAVLSLVCIAALAKLADGSGAMALAIATIGAVFGFLRYNTHPAVVFMGDTGSQFLGFAAGVLSIWLTQDVNTAIGGTLPLLILGLPVVDTLRVMGDRMARGVSPFKPDRAHFHHKLLALGFDHYEAVLLIYAVQALFIGLAFVLRYEADSLILAVYLLLSGALALFFPVAQGLRWRLRNLSHGAKSPLARGLEYLARKRWVETLVFYGVCLALLALLLAGSLGVARVGFDLGLSAVMALAGWTAATLLPKDRLLVLERLALYSCVVLITYLIAENGEAQPELEQRSLALVIALALLVGLGVRLSRRYFSVTPSDFLVLFVLVAAASLPVFSGINYARLAVEVAIALYAAEYVLRRLQRPSRMLRAGGMLALGVVAVRGLAGV